MILIPLAFGLCAFTGVDPDFDIADMIFVGHTRGVICDVDVGAGGDPGAEVEVEIDGHRVSVLWLGNDEGEVTIDGKKTAIGPRT